MSVPDGWVDPTAPDQVAGVLRAVQASSGPGGLADLVRRLPAVARTAPVARGLFRAAVPERLWLGPENVLTIESGGAVLVHEHVVNGVVLHRAALTAGDAPATLAAVIARHAVESGTVDDASAVLSAARDLEA